MEQSILPQPIDSKSIIERLELRKRQREQEQQQQQDSPSLLSPRSPQAQPQQEELFNRVSSYNSTKDIPPQRHPVHQEVIVIHDDDGDDGVLKDYNQQIIDQRRIVKRRWLDSMRHNHNPMPSSRQEPPLLPQLPQQLPPPITQSRESSSSSSSSLDLGYFTGETIYQNPIYKRETLENGHVSLANLIPPNCSSALITTFNENPPHNDLHWVDCLFSESVKELLIIRPPPGKADLPLIGDAVLQPMFPFQRDRHRHKKRSGWCFLYCKPHTRGLLHAKVFLFRSPDGLRIVVGGNNFTRYQMEQNRNCFWVQDFLVHQEEEGPVSNHNNSEFGYRFHDFLDGMSKCRQFLHEQWVQNLLKAVFQDICLSESKARLVYSFPRVQGSQEQKGGWKQLADTIEDLLLEGYDTTDDESHQFSYRRISTAFQCRPVLYTMSGSIGDVTPEFLQQMMDAFSGKTTSYPDEVTWNDIHGIRCLLPSSNSSLVGSPVAGRLLSYNYWNSIPEDARRQSFWEGAPNPTRERRLFHPFPHCKFLYKAASQGKTALLYVGSHNFSTAAWGIGGTMPRNTELGVVLATTNPSLQKQWEDRLPCHLPSLDAVPSTIFVPALSGDPSSKRKRHELLDRLVGDDSDIFHERLLQNATSTIDWAIM